MAGSSTTGRGRRTPDVDAVLQRAGEALTAGRVYGDAVERDGITVIPVARVAGGGGGGGGEGADAEGGSGVGYGVRARPVGAYVIRGGEVAWRPAIDVNQLLVWGNLTAIVFLLTRWRIARLRARRG